MHPHDLKILATLFAVAILTIAFLSSEGYAKQNPSDKWVKYLSRTFGSIFAAFGIYFFWILFH